MKRQGGSCSFVEAEGGEKRDEAKFGKFSRLLEAVHRLVYAKDDVGLAGGVGLVEGEEIKAGENVRGELVDEDFYELGRVKAGAKVEVRQVNRAKESVVRDDRVKEDVDGGERGNLSGGGGKRREDGHHQQYREHDGLRLSCSSAGGRGGGEKRGTPFPSPQDCSTWRERRLGGVVDGAEGPESFDEFDELVVASLQPLQTEGASKSRAEGE